MPNDPTGLLIVRAWIEDGSSEPLRFSIRQTTDVSAGFQSAVTLTDADATAEVVRLWLHDVLDAAGPLAR